MIYCTPCIVIDYMTFQRGMMGDLGEFIEKLEEASKAVKRAVGENNRGSVKIRFSNGYGTEFAFMLSKHTHMTTKETWYDLSVWDSLGHTSVISGIVPENSKERQAFIKKVVDFTEEYTRGKIHCSDCGKIVNYHDVQNNRYFAGIYCDDCWNRKWKAIEAKENYN